MISKIIKIKGIGKFKQFTCSGDDELRFFKRTVIFGHNTYGKSTLTTIFRSLKNSDQGLLKGKKTFGYSESSEIDILDENNKHSTLSNGNWSNPNIVVFDSNFVQNYVYLGDQIDFEHKASLHGIFVGENIGDKVLALKRLRNEQADLESDRDKVKNKYIKVDLGTFEEFLKAEKVESVDDKISKKETEIKRLNNISSIKEQIKHSPLASKFENFKLAMEKSLDTSAEVSIENHIHNHWKDASASKNFISEGVAILKDESKNCVFCGQDLEPVKDLIKDFKSVFGATYRQVQKEIESAGENFLRFDPEAEIAKLNPLGINCDELLNKKELLENKADLDKEIDKKLKNLNYSIDLISKDKPFQLFLIEIKKLHPVFDSILKQEFSEQDYRNLLNQLKKLKLSKYRHSKEGVSLTKDYFDAEKLIKDKKKEVKNLRDEINQETKKTIVDNQKEIEKVLKNELRAEFSIQKLDSRSNLTRSKSHFVDYEFAFGSQVVPISNKRSQDDIEPKDKYYFGNTLSDSDRRLLAIAIFISKLQTDKFLNKKIVVFDDPFSSLDSNRKDALVRTIVKIKNQSNEEPEQVIILTHDDSFLARLQSKIPKNETKFLQIKNSGSAGSSIVKCDVENVIEEEFFKSVKFIKDSVDNNRNVDEAIGKVRKCLERILRHKYYFSLDEKTLSEGSISAYLEKIGDKCLVKDDILENNWHEHMHDQHEIMKLNEPEKIQKLDDFLSLLEKI